MIFTSNLENQFCSQRTERLDKCGAYFMPPEAKPLRCGWYAPGQLWRWCLLSYGGSIKLLTRKLVFLIRYKIKSTVKKNQDNNSQFQVFALISCLSILFIGPKFGFESVLPLTRTCFEQSVRHLNFCFWINPCGFLSKHDWSRLGWFSQSRFCMCSFFTQTHVNCSTLFSLPALFCSLPESAYSIDQPLSSLYNAQLLRCH